MRRALFTVLASTTVLAFVPAVALARHDEHHRGRHHAHVRHDRVRRDSSQNGTTAAQPNAGTVQSFTADTLVITLANGSTVSGAVTGATELKCEAARDAEMQNEDRGSGGSADNRRGDGQGQGDDGNETNGEDQGDEPSGDEHMCATVTPGMVVREARLGISSVGAVWDEVELVAAR